MTTISGHIAQQVAAHTTDVFGLMGNGNAYFLDELMRTEVTYTSVRHEAAAVAAADAYARASRGVGFASVTYGAGFTNTLTALAEAAQARSSVVLIAGDEPSTGARPWGVDQIALAAAVGVPTITVNPATAAQQTVAAIERALHERTPIVLAIPYDFAGRTAPEQAPAGTVRPVPRPAPDAVALAEVASLLRGAQKPVIIAGRGAWLSDAAPALGELAALTGAVTATSAAGRSLFPATEFDLGVAGGFGQEASMQLIGEADVVLVVGARLNQFTTRFGHLFGADTHLIQVDLAAQATNPRVNTFVHGDARTTAEQLVTALDGHEPSPWRDTLSGFADGTYREVDRGVGVCEDGLLDPRTVASRLEEILPADRRVVSDGGHFIGWANSHWTVPGPDRMILCGTNYQSIGLGILSAVGASRVDEATTVVTTGDGGSLMALTDLESLARTAKRAIVVVWNDAAYGAEVHLYGVWGLSEEPMLIDRVNFAALGQAVGGDGIIINAIEDLDQVSEWIETHDTGTLVVDCRISRSVRALYQEEILAVNTAALEK